MGSSCKSVLDNMQPLIILFLLSVAASVVLGHFGNEKGLHTDDYHEDSKPVEFTKNSPKEPEHHIEERSADAGPGYGGLGYGHIYGLGGYGYGHTYGYGHGYGIGYGGHYYGKRSITDLQSEDINKRSSDPGYGYGYGHGYGGYGLGGLHYWKRSSDETLGQDIVKRDA